MASTMKLDATDNARNQIEEEFRKLKASHQKCWFPLSVRAPETIGSCSWIILHFTRRLTIEHVALEKFEMIFLEIIVVKDQLASLRKKLRLSLVTEHFQSELFTVIKITLAELVECFWGVNLLLIKPVKQAPRWIISIRCYFVLIWIIISIHIVIDCFLFNRKLLELHERGIIQMRLKPWVE